MSSIEEQLKLEPSGAVQCRAVQERRRPFGERGGLNGLEAAGSQAEDVVESQNFHESREAIGPKGADKLSS